MSFEYLYLCNVLNLAYSVVGHVYRMAEMSTNGPRLTWHVRLGTPVGAGADTVRGRLRRNSAACTSPTWRSASKALQKTEMI
jgi:hypothetical protein